MKNYEFVNCNLCGANDSIVISKKGRFNMPVQNVICKNCGLIYINPKMSKEYYDKFYSSKEYRQLYNQQEKPDEDYEKSINDEIIKRFRYILNILHTKNIEKGFVLDIGCNTGYLLHLFEKNGWKGTGIEPSKNFLEYGQKKYKLNIKRGFLKDIKLNKKFDIIILSHVLEHFPDINYALKIVRKLLKKNSLVYIEVPNIKKPYNNLSYFFQNAHLFTFSPITLKSFLNKNSFKTISLDDSEIFLKVFAKKGEKLEMQKENYHQVIKSLNKYKIKRIVLNTYDLILRTFFKNLEIFVGENNSKKIFNYCKKIKNESSINKSPNKGECKAM